MKISVDVEKDLQPPKTEPSPKFTGRNYPDNEGSEGSLAEEPPEPLPKNSPLLDPSHFEVFKRIEEKTRPVFVRLMSTERGRLALLAGKFITQKEFDDAEINMKKVIIPDFDRTSGEKSPDEIKAEIAEWDKRGQEMVEKANKMVGNK